MGSQGGFGQSKEFLDLIKSIGEARSKAEEDRIVCNEIETLKRRIIEPDIPKRKMKEFIMRLVYVEMLGHDASFGYIHAVKMTHDDNLLFKKTGYLAVTLFLNEDHDLIILIVNTIQKDLKSDNYLVVCSALNAVCKLINEDTIPAVLPQVVELLGHTKEAVRKKAVMALHRFYQKSPSSIHHLISNFRKRLRDNDPGVMAAALCPLFDLIKSDINSYKDLVVSLVNILKQVAERRLPKSYDYHNMPAPFIQIKLLKILALLGSGDKKASENMFTIVGDVMRKCDLTTNIGSAILYECICCVSSIHPSPKLLESAADAISKFLKTDNHNLKYLGIDALGRLIKISPEIAEQHQLAVIDCLEDPDDTLKRKTFELLYKMTKSSNVEVIVDRMIEYMININDYHYRTEIASRCVELAEQFAPSNQWFILTMNKVFENAGDLVNMKTVHNLMRLIAEGFGEDDNTADTQLRSSAVESYLQIMGEPKLPSAFLQVICWVLGEYGTAGGKYSAAYITGKICDVAEAHSTDDIVKVDRKLSFLNGYVQESLEKGAQPYIPESERSGRMSLGNFRNREHEGNPSCSLKFKAYDLPKPLLPSMVAQVSQAFSTEFVPVHEPSHHPEAHEAVASKASVSDSGSSEIKLRLDGVQRKWGMPTYSAVTPSTSDSEAIKTQNGATHSDGMSSMNSKARESSYDSRRKEVEIDPEKKKFAASLFGSTSTSERSRSSSHQSLKANNHAAEKFHMDSNATSDTGADKTAPQPPPDLLDLGNLPSNSAPLVDPFKQLEGLVDLNQGPSAPVSGGVVNNLSSGPGNANLMSDGNGHRASTIPQPTPFCKGPNQRDALEKDALVRQMGVMPSTKNPILFKDLLG
nr:AP-4 complex subunit epsilon [Ipomoea batatas]